MSNPHGNGDAFIVTYHLHLEPGIDVDQFARNICLEQTVELSDDLIVEDSIRDRVVGKILSIQSRSRHIYELKIAYQWQVAGHELPQLLNVLFGNISLKHGIKWVDFEGQSPVLPGPKFGLEGLRKAVQAWNRPLVCTALKPMGSSPNVLAEMAYHLALGGLDIIKDDHGLANQPFAPFEERVRQVQAAVLKANRETGGNTLYFPNFVPQLDDFSEQLALCRQLGIRGLLVSPFLVGLDMIRALRAKGEFILMAHPALSGGYFGHPHHGIEPGLLLGKWFRMMGADASIYPNVGGRFIFDLDTCQAINRGCRESLSHILPAFPVPAGGMSLQQIPQMRRLYGDDMIILIGSGLFREDPNLLQAARKFRLAVENPL